MLHGYGAGLAFFYKNYEALSRRPGWKLWSLDLLGMGRSARPAFRIHAKDRVGKISEAESWFVDALEAWRVQRGIPMGGMTLVGHSLGGYLAVAYALKYPGRLDKLILASPVGIPEDPYAVNAELPDGQMEEQEVGGNGKETLKRPYPRWLTTLWDANVSPFSLVRWAGPLGPRLVSGWSTRRFAHLPENEASALHDYSYSLFRQKGSGEYALAYILAPGAFARSPLIRRIHGVGRQYLEPHDRPIPDAELGEETDKASSLLAARHGPRENGIPVVLMYGDRDWMDVSGGFAAEEKIKQEKRLALEGKSKEEKSRDNGDAKVVIIPRAGHHIYLDNAEDFNRVVLEEMEDVERRQRRLEALKSAS
jgi:cardiolipin-specific phospholipase